MSRYPDGLIMRRQAARRSVFAPLLLLIVTGLAEGGGAADASVPAIRPAKAESIRRWRRMAFGIFVHWGPVSLTGKEIGWSRGDPTPRKTYDNLYKRFDPERFDADRWARLFKAAGARYVVLTAKHHDGFCMWDSKHTDYDIMASPYGRDIVGAVSDACKRHGLAFGPYYSILDWYQPDYPNHHGAGPGYTLDREPDMDRYVRYMKNQLRELQRSYGPFLVFWFDGEWEEPWTHARGVALNNYCRKLQPDVLINNRVDKGRQAGTFRAERYAGDFATPEQEIGAFDRETPWETCMTLGTQWAWKPDDRIKSLRTCVRTLVRTVGGDGNLLLNVGPMPDGRIEPRQAKRLRAIGDWLDRFGESVYGTRGGPFKPGQWGASTCRGRTIYLHVFRWAGGVRLPSIDAEIQQAKLLTGGAVRVEQDNAALRVEVPPEDRQAIDTVVELTVDRRAMKISPVDVPVSRAGEED